MRPPTAQPEPALPTPCALPVLPSLPVHRMGAWQPLCALLERPGRSQRASSMGLEPWRTSPSPPPPHTHTHTTPPPHPKLKLKPHLQPQPNAEDVLERDFFMSAAEARDFGIVDEVIEQRPPAEADAMLLHAQKPF